MPRLRREHRPFLLTAALLAWAAAGPALCGPLIELDEALRADGLNSADLQRRERGYYEQLLDAGRRLDADSDAMVPALSPADDQGPAASNRLTVAVDDARETALIPRFSTSYLGVTWSTNELGLRDREYDRSKPPGTFRIALLGDSIAAGWGVADGQNFESRLEEALDTASRRAGGPRIEILNFAVPGHAPGQRIEHFVRSGGWDLGIDLILLEASPADAGWDIHRLRRTAWLGSAFEAPVYRAVLTDLGVRPGREVEYYKRKLKPYRWTVLEAVYRHIAVEARVRRVPVAWFLIPRVGKANDVQDHDDLLKRARAFGFRPVLDLSGVFDGVEPESLAVAPNDYHPNAEGHARLAAALLPALQASPPDGWPLPATPLTTNRDEDGRP